MEEYRTSRLAFPGPVAPLWAMEEEDAWAGDPARLPDVYDLAMTRIDDRNAAGVAFMFRSKHEANRRVRGGGSAFVVGRYLEGSRETSGDGRPAYLPYLITNAHVAIEGADRCCVASVNKRDGGPPAVWEFAPDEWVPHPDGDDLAAACAFGRFDNSQHLITFLPEQLFITPALQKIHNVGMGDETFMLGRFYNLQGRHQNRPSLRQGGISMMPEEVWVEGRKRQQLSYGVEMRSKEGFSGSPVVVWRKPWTMLAEEPSPQDSPLNNFWFLLGVNWGYICDERGENTWLNGVVPAWKITELLDAPALKKIHAECEAEIAKDVERLGAAKQAVYVEEPADADANPHHKEDFTALLGAAVGKPKQGD